MHDHRTHRATITNHSQVSDDLDRCGWSVSKLWNVGLYHIQTEWDTTGEIPGEGDLKSELKGHEKYTDLQSQSSQRVLEELAEAFHSWYGSSDTRDNPPGFRKRNYYDEDGNLVHEEHPRSTVTWKQKGIRHDTENDRLRLSKGFNHKESRDDYILCEYDTRDDVAIENVQQVRAVYEHGEWRLHIVCKHEIETPDPPGDETAGIDLGICNFAAVAYSNDEATLYPGNYLKENEYYFTKEVAKCDRSWSNRATRLNHKRTERRSQFIHAWAKHVVEDAKENNVGRIAIGDLGGIRDDENGDAVNWGKHGNLDLHGWPFDKATKVLTYKAKAEGITVDADVSERDTSKTCSACGKIADRQRVERGLYRCEVCGMTANADVNGAENIRRRSNSESPSGDRSTGWLAQPVVHLHDRTHGFSPGAPVVDCKP
ncbi:RNA-guided endonuclease InsQ/TnpB family protein [Halococcus thailandensis]|uniref:Transposase, IS605 OrfB family protein n=1 Tax=Halococcus thailandensis JCM 13552 TaxID=1227457 RepID=M0N324_9EURY|nr:RNA-guided endonuclease TnpB family protein [Halococcus thailandensis]EMA51090.1 transposase, IS605 OrfB family protein [Halococcus thailandensis JCM 13552]